MLTAIRQRLQKDEDGFTLIELMVVVLIIAILIAIAIPTFLGAQDRARDRGAQSDLRNGLTAAKTLATDNSGLFLNPDGTADIVAADMLLAEPSLGFVDAIATIEDASSVYVATETGGTNITLVKKSASDTYFGISATKNGEVTYCKSADVDDCDDGVLDAANFKPKW
jgi:type IV pilus assembly protein PilA